MLIPKLGLSLILLTTPAAGHAQARQWDTYPDTWVAGDALGRTLPGPAQVGAPRADKTVGIFYFLTFAHEQDKIYDNSKILSANPEAMNDVYNPAWGPLNAAHYWGEPLFGYYASDDEWVLRKHATMLSNAGVDMVIFDNSNAVTYDKARNTLCRVWEQMRREGLRTPQIAFHCPFGNGNNIGTETLNKLYETIYAPGKYSDLWFRWQGKPLIIAYPNYADPTALTQLERRQPENLAGGDTLGQTFTVTHSFQEAGGVFPTWTTTTSGLTLSLYADGPHGKRLTQKQFSNVKDSATLVVGSGETLPPGKYYLEISRPVGHIGWWTEDGGGALAGAYQTGEPILGSRFLRVRYTTGGEPEVFALPTEALTPAMAEERAHTLREFFTYRTPIAPYNIQKPDPNAWAWLQVYPQAPQIDTNDKPEEISVGVAQNYNATVNGTAPMSFPGAFSRSYHNGKLDTTPGAVNWGYNFNEQWKQAQKIDPPFIFITGWNEWTAGFYTEWAGFHAPPAIFVDEFNQEGSRDIEPMRGGHGDNYYYQLAANIRRYKGVSPLPAVTPHPITIDGRFDDWKGVGPEFRDAIGDNAKRSAPGFGALRAYKNTTGRNDIVAAKVSYDTKNAYFYVRTRAKMTPRTGADWMRLYLNTDANSHTGWLGYDFAINRKPGDKTTTLDRFVSSGDRWRPMAGVQYAMHGNEMEIAVPRAMLGLKRSPATIDFKWADRCEAKGDWTDFTLNGDAAPDDRFNYRAKLR